MFTLHKPEYVGYHHIPRTILLRNIFVHWITPVLWLHNVVADLHRK